MGCKRRGSSHTLEDARRAARFVRTHLWNPATRTLLRRYRKGDAGVEGYAEDYAFLIFGLLELFQADGDPQWLAWALDLQQRQDELFWDEADAGSDIDVLVAAGLMEYAGRKSFVPDPYYRITSQGRTVLRSQKHERK